VSSNQTAFRSRAPFRLSSAETLYEEFNPEIIRRVIDTLVPPEADRLMMELQERHEFAKSLGLADEEKTEPIKRRSL
jgi:hypothetical protein